jgi:hypothetical protein
MGFGPDPSGGSGSPSSSWATTYATLDLVKAATGSDNDIAYCVETETLYRYEASGSSYTADDKYYLITGDGGDTRWIGASGQYKYKEIAGNLVVGNSEDNVGYGQGVFGSLTSGTKNSVFGDGSAAGSLTSGTGHVIFGYGAAANVTASGYGVYIGHQAGASTSYGNVVLIGTNCGDANIGQNIVAIGYYSARGLGNYGCSFGNESARYMSGANNAVFGYYTGRGQSGSLGTNNCLFGYYVAPLIRQAYFNSVFGAEAGGAIVDNDYGVYLGAYAGKYETASYKLFIDSLDRTDEATGRTSSLLYGEFNATPSSQYLTINGDLNLTYRLNLPKCDSSVDGVIRVDSTNFLHTFQHPTGDTAIPSGRNIFMGVAAGNFTLGSTATETYHASDNIGIGPYTLTSTTTGYQNAGIGYGCLNSLTSGYDNFGMGAYCLWGTTTGAFNCGVGIACLQSNQGGNSNVGIGAYSLNSNVSGSANIGIGTFAGKYETGSYTVYINSIDRTNTAGDKSASLLYGVCNASMGSQFVRFNGNLGIGTNTFGTNAVSVLCIANGTIPSTSPADSVQVYAEDVTGSSELRVRDEAGNVTTLSPHNFSLIPDGPSEELSWAYYGEKEGKKINVDMLKLARIIEQLSGEKLVYTQGG